MVFVLFPDLPHPILVLLGEQGTGKSTAARIISSWIDPSPAQLRSSPRDIEQFAVSLSASHVAAFDNMSEIRGWLSDAMCRAVTGDAMVRRRLYSNDELSVLAYRRVIMLNGIVLGALRGDLAERVLRCDLGTITDGGRRQDSDVLDAWHKVHPRALGALLDVAAEVLSVLPHVHLGRLPRMADFARVLKAVDQVRGTRALDTYLGMAGNLAEDVVEDDVVASAIRSFVTRNGAWTGTSGELVDKITAPEPRPKDWPASGQVMAGILKRTAPVFRSVGIEVRYNDGKRPRTWTLEAESREDSHESDGSVKVTDEPSDEGTRASEVPTLVRHSGQGTLEGDGASDMALTRESVARATPVTSNPPISRLAPEPSRMVEEEQGAAPEAWTYEAAAPCAGCGGLAYGRDSSSVPRHPGCDVETHEGLSG